jgi:hypothetical protein
VSPEAGVLAVDHIYDQSLPCMEGYVDLEGHKSDPHFAAGKEDMRRFSCLWRACENSRS